MTDKTNKKVKVSVYLMPEDYKIVSDLSEFSGINKSLLTAMSAQAGIKSLDKILRGKKYQKYVQEIKANEEKKQLPKAGRA